MLKIGSVIDGKYKILNIVGKGGMSVVYLAMNEKVNKQWAIKEIIKKDYRDFDVDKKEIEMMKRLKHPNLPAIVDVIEQKDSLLIVMDYIEGRSLEDIVLEYGPQNEKSVIRWAKQLCDVLNYLHTCIPPIIYRDMKPANVMLKPDGNVMLIDFGAAREYKPKNLKDTVLLGTRGYAAPEQYRSDGQSDARTDIYSLGITVFRLLTGENPQELCPIRELRPELSAGLETILLKCTRIRKEERYRSAAELLFALNHYWEYDEKYRKKQKKKLIQFAIPAVLTFLFAVSALIFAILENYTRQNNYEAYLLAAGNSATKEEELENYRKAIQLNPENEEAYLSILRNTFLDDGTFTQEESEILREIFIDYSDTKNTNESVFRQNTEGYARFAYEAGIAYFYKFEDQNNKKNARSYFEIAANSGVLNERMEKRAERLLVISDYYANIGIIDEAGDIFVTYKNYWNDLVDATEGNLVEEDNGRTALVMYEELVGQIISRTVKFRNSGVGKEEMLQQLEDIKAHLKNDFSEIDREMYQALEEDIERLSNNIQKAEKMIESTFKQEKQEERWKKL